MLVVHYRTSLLQLKLRLCLTRMPTVAEIADRTALEILGVGSLKARGRCRRLRVVPSFSYEGTSYSLVRTLSL